MSGAISEQTIHQVIIRHLLVRGPPKTSVWHTPNGGYRSPVEAGTLKSMGTRAGIPDLALLRDGKLYFLEVTQPAKITATVWPAAGGP